MHSYQCKARGHCRYWVAVGTSWFITRPRCRVGGVLLVTNQHRSVQVEFLWKLWGDRRWCYHLWNIHRSSIGCRRSLPKMSHAHHAHHAKDKSQALWFRCSGFRGLRTLQHGAIKCQYGCLFPPDRNKERAWSPCSRFMALQQHRKTKTVSRMRKRASLLLPSPTCQIMQSLCPGPLQLRCQMPLVSWFSW